MAASAFSAAAFWAHVGETVTTAAAASAAQPTRCRPRKVICILPLCFVCRAELFLAPPWLECSGVRASWGRELEMVDRRDDRRTTAVRRAAGMKSGQRSD